MAPTTFKVKAVPPIRVFFSDANWSNFLPSQISLENANGCRFGHRNVK